MRDENKTKKQLINEVVELRQRVSELEASEIERKRAEEALLKRTYDLGERVKELNCLYGISDLTEKPNIMLEEIFKGTVELIPPCWQYSEITCARLTLKGQEFKTKNFRETTWKQSSGIIVYGERVGTLDVCYLEKRPRRHEGPFLKEERHLINAVAKRLGRITERRQMEEVFLKRTHDLGERVKELNCLYGISNLVEREGILLEEIIQGTVDLIPPCWQYPEITCARLTLKGQEFITKNFRETTWKQSSGIIVYGERVGTLYVCYLEKKPKSHEGPFLKEERHLINVVAERLGRIIERKQAEKALLKRTHDLSERVKELNCLYGISDIVEKPNVSLENIFQGTVNLIPSSWQYPEITCSRIMLKGCEFKTKNYKETKWKQSSDIFMYGERVGTLDVCFLEKRPRRQEGPFLREERNLINVVAERLGRIIERKRAEKALKESKKKLKEMNVMLKEKNIALKEFMSQLEMEKKNMEDKVLSNVEKLLLPLLGKLKSKGSQLDKEYVGLLEDNLRSMTSSFGSEISRKILKLSPREIEICNMIKSDLSSKEIARILNISYRSVETYRNHVRKKLGIINTKTNLTSYLKTLQENTCPPN